MAVCVGERTHFSSLLLQVLLSRLVTLVSAGHGVVELKPEFEVLLEIRISLPRRYDLWDSCYLCLWVHSWTGGLLLFA